MKKFKNLSLLLIYCFFISALNACSPVFYAATGVNVPLLREKNEIQLKASGLSSKDISGYDIQAAYAATGKIGLMANSTYMGSDDSLQYVTGSGRVTEAAIGYIKPFSNIYVFEMYAGGGLGEATNKYKDSTLNVKFTKYFIQPNIGYSSDHFSIAFSPKIAYIQYNKPVSSSYTLDGFGNPVAPLTGMEKNFVSFEPALTVRGGIKYAKLQFQVVRSFQKIEERNDYSISLGLHLSLAPRYRKVAE